MLCFMYYTIGGISSTWTHFYIATLRETHDIMITYVVNTSTKLKVKTKVEMLKKYNIFICNGIK